MDKLLSGYFSVAYTVFVIVNFMYKCVLYTANEIHPKKVFFALIFLG